MCLVKDLEDEGTSNEDFLDSPLFRWVLPSLGSNVKDLAWALQRGQGEEPFIC